MIGWLAFIGYLVAAVFTGSLILRSQRDLVRDGFDRALVATMSFLAGLFWPLAAPVGVVIWLSTLESPRQRRDRLAVERDKRVRELQWTIRRLERELHIGEAS